MNALARFFAIVVTLALASCGGGMQAGVGSGGSGAPLSVGVGPVTGFGSILMNGARYDETSAEMFIDERPDRPTPVTVAAIRLGMRVELQHNNFVIATGTASSELIGPVSSVTASGFVALGQTVRVNADSAHSTVFEGFSALSDLGSGAVVEVHGDRAPNGDILATRVELRPTGLPLVRIAGTASGVTGKTFSIGGLAIDAASATVAPAGATIANGQRVVAWTDVPYTGGALVPKIVRVGMTTITTNAAVTLDGVVGDFQSSASFRVSGVAVNAGSATFTGGTAANLVNGTSVRVRGTVANGVINAASVEFLQAASVTTQLTGPITDFVGPNAPFRIRNTLTTVTAQTTFTGGAATNLGSGVVVRVDGLLTNGIVQATTVEFVVVAAGTQRVVSGQVRTAITSAASDGTRTFRLDALSVDVKTTTTTTFRNGVAADVTAGRQVRVTGSVQGTQFVADQVEFLDSATSPPTLEIEGIASNVQANSVTVNGQAIQLTASTTYTLNGTATTIASLRNGLEVDIVASQAAGKLTAQSVDILSISSSATTVRGQVSERSGPDDLQFLVGTQRVSAAGNPQIIPANRTLANVVNGSDVEVEGTLANGVLNATRIRFR